MNTFNSIVIYLPLFNKNTDLYHTDTWLM